MPGPNPLLQESKESDSSQPLCSQLEPLTSRRHYRVPFFRQKYIQEIVLNIFDLHSWEILIQMNRLELILLCCILKAIRTLRMNQNMESGEAGDTDNDRQ